MAAMTLDKLLAKYPAEVQTLALSARTFIGKAMPEAGERLAAHAGVAGSGKGRADQLRAAADLKRPGVAKLLKAGAGACLERLA
jgi:hypothetical protein